MLWCWFDEDTPMELIRTVKPDVLVKGGDYSVETVVGHEEVIAAGGRVEIVADGAGVFNDEPGGEDEGVECSVKRDRV